MDDPRSLKNLGVTLVRGSARAQDEAVDEAVDEVVDDESPAQLAQFAHSRPVDETKRMPSERESVLWAIDRLYGSVACTFQLRMSQEGGNTSKEGELAFMAEAFMPLILRESVFYRHVCTYASKLLEGNAFEERCSESGLNSKAWALETQNSEETKAMALEMLRLCQEVRRAEFAAVIYVFETTGDMSGWAPFIEKRMEESFQQVACSLYESANRNPSYVRKLDFDVASLVNRETRQAAAEALCADVGRE